MSKSRNLLYFMESVNEEPPSGWKKLIGDDILNQRGDKPYKTVFEKNMGGRGKPVYELSVLLHDKGYYLAAHGGVIMPDIHKTALKAADAALKWYYLNTE
jgi:hypothetical protein